MNMLQLGYKRNIYDNNNEPLNLQNGQIVIDNNGNLVICWNDKLNIYRPDIVLPNNTELASFQYQTWYNLSQVVREMSRAELVKLYPVGSTREETFILNGVEEKVTFVVLDHGVHTISKDGSNTKQSMTIGMLDCLRTFAPYHSSTGSGVRWSKGPNIRTYLNNEIFPVLSADLQNAIKPTILSCSGNTTSTDELFLLSLKNININTDKSGNDDVVYTYYTQMGSRIKRGGADNSIVEWWTRDDDEVGSYYPYRIKTDGSYDNYSGTTSKLGVSFVFNIG